MQLYKRGNAWLTAEQLIEYNKRLGSVLSEEKREDEVLVAKEAKVAQNASQSLTDDVVDKIPTNFMQLKKYAKEKGVDISIYKTKEEILKQLTI
ncbi:hypothetical protein [Methanoculleus sp.]|jgi:hypothetical protein|uniref:hypothetical protein n=1 Tax=Methanoculleus sp. TaxID=90427 RepID=UPI0025FC16AF|nr:hypothetical protein [Methanoculleus sp.]MCK9319985.1 hypothetical protein [Methanoculleus sp.]